MSERYELTRFDEDGYVLPGPASVIEMCDECGALVPVVELERHAAWHRRLEQILTLLGFNW